MHLRPQRRVHRTEQQLAQIQSEAASDARDLQHPEKRALRKPATRAGLLPDALVNQVEKLRDAAEQGNVALAQGAQQFRRVERFQENDAGASGQRQQQVGHLRQGVKQRQHAKNGVARVDVNQPKCAFGFGGEVVVGEHHALGIAGRSGGVENAAVSRRANV